MADNEPTNPEDWVNGQAARITASAAAGASNVTNVTITVKDMLGRTRSRVKNMNLYLSDSATGVGITATTASGTVVAGASGVDLGDLTAKKVKLVQTTAAGVYILQITDTAKTPFVVCVDLLNGHRPLIALTLAAGNYG